MKSTKSPITTFATAAVARAARAEPGSLLRGLLWMNVALIVLAAVHGFIQSRDLGRHTDGNYVVLVSMMEMFATAAFAFAIYRRRRRDVHPSNLARQRCVIWALIGLGFVYLPFDEWFEIHQGIDRFIHHALAMQETALSDRIDDAVIALYGLLGLGALALGWKELQGRIDRRWLVSGFVSMGVSVVFDAVSDRPDVATWLVGNATQGLLLNGIFQVIEALSQIAAQSIFLVTFYKACLGTRGAGEPHPLPPGGRD